MEEKSKTAVSATQAQALKQAPATQAPTTTINATATGTSTSLTVDSNPAVNKKPKQSKIHALLNSEEINEDEASSMKYEPPLYYIDESNNNIAGSSASVVPTNNNLGQQIPQLQVNSVADPNLITADSNNLKRKKEFAATSSDEFSSNSKDNDNENSNFNSEDGYQIKRENFNSEDQSGQIHSGPNSHHHYYQGNEGEDGSNFQSGVRFGTDRRTRRLIRNRIAAQESRHKKKVYVNELEDKVNRLANQNFLLNREVNLLKKQLDYGTLDPNKVPKVEPGYETPPPQPIKFDDEEQVNSKDWDLDTNLNSNNIEFNYTENNSTMENSNVPSDNNEK